MGVQVHELGKYSIFIDVKKDLDRMDPYPYLCCAGKMTMYVVTHFGAFLRSLGHNLGMKHSGEVATYDDHTCLMGNPSYADDLHAMCFNGVKSCKYRYGTVVVVSEISSGDKPFFIRGVRDFRNCHDERYNRHFLTSRMKNGLSPYGHEFVLP